MPCFINILYSKIIIFTVKKSYFFYAFHRFFKIIFCKISDVHALIKQVIDVVIVYSCYNFSVSIDDYFVGRNWLSHPFLQTIPWFVWPMK